MDDSTHNLESGFVKLVVNELFAIDSDVQIVLRGHLYCESSLLRYVRYKLPSPEYLDDYRGGFSNLVTFAGALGYLNRSIYISLCKLNDIRNRVAHRLEYKIGDDESLCFANVIKGAVGEDKLSDHIVKTTKWYLGMCSTASTRLRRCVFLVWALMEIDYAIRCDGLLIGDAITEIDSAMKAATSPLDQELLRAIDLLKRLTPSFSVSPEMRSMLHDSPLRR